MGKLTLAPKTDFVPLETDFYTGTLQNHKTRDRDKDQYHPEPYQDIEFTWSVEVPAELCEELDITSPVERKSWVNIPKSFNDKAKLVLLGIALGVLDPNSGDEEQDIDLDDWLTRKCRLQIEQTKKKDGTPTDKIVGYTPYKRSKKAKTEAELSDPAPAKRVSQENTVSGEPVKPKKKAAPPPPPSDDDEDDSDSAPF